VPLLSLLLTVMGCRGRFPAGSATVSWLRLSLSLSLSLCVCVCVCVCVTLCICHSKQEHILSFCDAFLWSLSDAYRRIDQPFCSSGPHLGVHPQVGPGRQVRLRAGHRLHRCVVSVCVCVCVFLWFCVSLSVTVFSLRRFSFLPLCVRSLSCSLPRPPGIWNERDSNGTYVKALRQALNSNGFT
jgi:hypothetical protein